MSSQRSAQWLVEESWMNLQMAMAVAPPEEIKDIAKAMAAVDEVKRRVS